MAKEGNSVNTRRAAAVVYAVLSAGAAAFQIALALGAPWGSYAMGGAFPGQFPPVLRVSALVQAAILLVLAGLVLARADVALHSWFRASRWLVWPVVAISALGLVLNLVTPSAGERMIWAPVAFLLLASSLIVATARFPTSQ